MTSASAECLFQSWWLGDARHVPPDQPFIEEQATADCRPLRFITFAEFGSRLPGAASYALESRPGQDFGESLGFVGAMAKLCITFGLHLGGLISSVRHTASAI